MKKIFLQLAVLLLLQILNFPVFAQTASVTCPGNKTVSTDPTVCSAIVNNIDPVVSPTNAVVYYKIAHNGLTDFGTGSVSGKSFEIGISTVTYYLPDYPGVSCSFTITVEDHVPPVMHCPPNITVSCPTEIPFPGGAYAVDACSSGTTIVAEFVNDVKSNETCFNRYIITRTYRATDAAGNSATCSQIITVYDDKPPYFLQPAPLPSITVSCPANVQPGYGLFTAFDECSVDPSGEEVDVVFKEVKTNVSCPNKYDLERTWTATDLCGNKSVYSQAVHVNDTIGPVFKNPPANILIHCAAEIPEAKLLSAEDNCSGGEVTVTLQEIKSNELCVNKFKLTRIWMATDACGNVSTCKQEIVVEDNQPPVFDSLPPTSLINISCTKDIPPVSRQTAKDNCGEATVAYSETKTNVQCVNRYTLTRKWVATDACGNSVSRTQTINVNDNTPPTVAGINADPVVLWPPNHKMRDVTINYTAFDNCEVTSELSVSSSDPINGGSDGDQSPDWEIVDAHHVKLRAEKANNGQARYYTINIHVTDGCNAAIDTAITVIVAHNITSPQTGHPYKIGSIVTLNGVFWDKPGNTHTSKWLLDGSAVANGTVTEPAGNQNGKISGSYKFNAAGVYKLQMNVTDQTGATSYANTNNDLDAIVVIYDPNGGYSYGGGWFPSLPGALTSNTAAEGKASYGFSVNYRNGTKPKGETQFEFKVGSFEFNALNFDYLAISGAKAQFSGTGKIIGGQSGVGFIMTVKDGAIDGGTEDKIRMKIFNRNTGYVYYDNQPGASDVADPLTAVGTNSSIVIQGSETMTTARNEEQTKEILPAKFELTAYPNPTSQYFNLQVKTNDPSTKIQLLVYDQLGMLLEKRDDVLVGSVIRLGENYKAGIYYARMIQGKQHSEVKLVKF